MHAALKMANASVSSHAERRKRTVKMYSTPSGHAVAINTSEPNSTATPSEISSRDRPSGPPDPDPVDVGAGVIRRRHRRRRVGGRRGRPGGRGRHQRSHGGDGVVGDGEEERRAATALPVGLGDEPRDRALALRQRIGNRDTERDPVDAHRGVPTAIGDPLQTTSTVLVAPSGEANVSSSDGGEASTVLPAAGVDDTSVLSAASTCGTANAPTAAMPTMTAGPNRATARPMARRGEREGLHAGNSTLEDGREEATPPRSANPMSHPLSRLDDDGYSVALPPLSPATFQRAARAGARGAGIAKRRHQRARRAGVPVLRPPWHGQDHVGTDPRQGAQLRAAGRWRAVLRVRLVHRRRARHQLRRARARRGEQQRRRRDARPHREGVARHTRAATRCTSSTRCTCSRRPPRRRC